MDVTAELDQVYENLSKPPLLYEDVQCHLGDYGVFKWSDDNLYYRVSIKEELASDIVVLFVDFGNILVVPRCEVYAPVNTLQQFSQPAFGIQCQIDMPESRQMTNEMWSEVMIERSVHVQIGSCDGDIYKVSFTESASNKPVIEALAQLGRTAESPASSSPVIAPEIIIQGDISLKMN